MKKLLLAGILAFITPAYAAPSELPVEMTGYWMPMYENKPTELIDPFNPGPMRRIPEPAYEWEVSQDQWIAWDEICKIHDVKQLGEIDYEVGATCDLDETVSENRYQFSLCGEILNVHKLEDNQPAEPEGCKIS